jgi:hypothetical protein
MLPSSARQDDKQFFDIPGWGFPSETGETPTRLEIEAAQCL